MFNALEKVKNRRVVNMKLTTEGEQKVQEIFLKLPQEKLTEIANVLTDVNQLMQKIF
ncbi:Putative HTH-type transcriptional regulator YusO OS=Lysinibacillus sphaericus OX=1421 GN=yusO_4 PE=4 SV=1 [Lysinibacillus sphaericus]